MALGLGLDLGLFLGLGKWVRVSGGTRVCDEFRVVIRVMMG